MHRSLVSRRAAATQAAPAIAVFAALALAACGGAPAASPTPAAPTAAPATAGPTTVPATSAPTQGATGPANVEAPATVAAGVQFDVGFTGPNENGDYVTIVAKGATKWTNEPYFYVALPSPQKLTAPAAAGAYELWYVKGLDDSILFRRDITVTAFTGSLDGPDSVGAGKTFQVTWTGPDGPGDYVTIVKAGAARWSNESYFYTANGNPGMLQAPIDEGAFELWYVLGGADTITVREPITVLPVEASVSAPGSAPRGGTFDVAWTGPDGPGDYITIVKAGSPENAYLAYCYTSQGPTCSLTAPEEGGAYEVRYVTQAGKVIASRPIDIK